METFSLCAVSIVLWASLVWLLFLFLVTATAHLKKPFRLRSLVVSCFLVLFVGASFRSSLFLLYFTPSSVWTRYEREETSWTTLAGTSHSFLSWLYIRTWAPCLNGVRTRLFLSYVDFWFLVLYRLWSILPFEELWIGSEVSIRLCIRSWAGHFPDANGVALYVYNALNCLWMPLLSFVFCMILFTVLTAAAARPLELGKCGLDVLSWKLHSCVKPEIISMHIVDHCPLLTHQECHI